MLTTQQKIAFVRIVSTPVRLINTIFYKSPIRVRRRKINWCLDLNEVIDLVIYLIGNFEPKTIRQYQQTLKSGAIVFDIGANIGSHTLPLAKIVQPNGMVFAFEPTLYAVTKLSNNVEIHPTLSKCIKVEQILLSDQKSSLEVHEIESSWPIKTSKITHNLHGGEAKSIAGSEVITLDTFVIKNKVNVLDLIKIDVDGNEINILKGGIKTIKKLKPLIMFELAPYALREKGHSGEELLQILNELGYKIYKNPTGLQINKSNKELCLSVPEGASINLWGVPG